MRRVHSVLILAVLFFIFQQSAFAQLVNGKVVSVDAGGNKVTLSTMNGATGAEERAEVSVGPQTQFVGVGDLQALKAGDEIWVDAEPGTDGILKASKITKA